ncbi:component of SufBCD complex [Rhodobacteraceae bacterium]|nr:component of SufBCD complex [Paracoccaceae bacterium]
MKAVPVTFLDLFAAMIDTRSFSSIWYWGLLAIMWSLAGIRILGVPFDQVIRYRTAPASAGHDLLMHAKAEVSRRQGAGGIGAIGLTAVVCFVLSMIFMLGFIYKIELSQAVFFLALPQAILAASGARTRLRLASAVAEQRADLVAQILSRRRRNIQLLGLLFILLTAFWGMLHTLARSFMGIGY